MNLGSPDIVREQAESDGSAFFVYFGNHKLPGQSAIAGRCNIQ